MQDDKTERQRQRAHAIWEREGRPDGRHEDHWHEAERTLAAEAAAAQVPGNEGEGSRTGDRAYDEATRRFVAAGKVKGAARKAKASLAGPEAEELKRAEAEGRRRSRGENPALKG